MMTSCTMLNNISRCTVYSHRVFNFRCTRFYHCLKSSQSIYKTRNFLPLIHKCSFSFAQWPNVLSSSAPVVTLQELLISLHDVAQYQWWAVIMLATLGFRTCVTLPLAIHQQQVMARLENVAKEMSGCSPTVQYTVNYAAKLNNWDLKTSKRIFNNEMRKRYNEMVIRDNCHPFKGAVLVLIQMPMWVCLSASLRNLAFMLPSPNFRAQLYFLQLKTEGLLWFSDLTRPDVILIPLLIGAINMFLIEMHSVRKIAQKSKIQKILKNCIRCVTVGIVLFAAVSPSCMSFYWLCSSTFGLLQNVCLMMPRVRRFLRIPVTQSESLTPFKDIGQNFRTIVSRK